MRVGRIDRTALRMRVTRHYPGGWLRGLGDFNVSRSRLPPVLPRSRIVRGLLARCFPRWSVAVGIETFDRLLHERPMQSNATIDLFRQNLKTLVTEQNRFALPLLRDRRRHGQLVSRVECDCLGHHTHIVFEPVEPGVHLVETLLHQLFD